MDPISKPGNNGRPPFALKARSSFWFVTFVVGLGIAVDLLVYSIIIPVLPFQLEHLGYTGVSALTGWLLLAYSGGLIVSTIPVAMFSERTSSRKAPLVAGIIILVGSQIMLMEAPNYWVMCIARVIQGVGSTLVWVVGLALLCDSSPVALIGRQLGIATVGLSLGFLVGPSAGGSLYTRFGFRGPFIFGIIASVLDLVCRLLVIERYEAIPWGVDPASQLPLQADTTDIEKPPQPQTSSTAPENQVDGDKNASENPSLLFTEPESEISTVAPVVPAPPISLVSVIHRLGKSPRSMVAIIVILVYGLVFTSQEPALPLHLQEIWNMSSSRVGVVYLAAVIPTLISTPVAGYYADTTGQGIVTIVSIIFSLPWWVVCIIDGPLALFITSFALQNFFVTGVIAGLTSELAAVSREIEGIGYAHVYGAFNLAYGAGSCLGPIVGGQLYDHLDRGWMVICLLAVGLLVISAVMVFFYTGDTTLYHQITRRPKRSSTLAPHES